MRTRTVAFEDRILDDSDMPFEVYEIEEGWSVRLVEGRVFIDSHTNATKFTGIVVFEKSDDAS